MLLKAISLFLLGFGFLGILYCLTIGAIKMFFPRKGEGQANFITNVIMFLICCFSIWLGTKLSEWDAQ